MTLASTRLENTMKVDMRTISARVETYWPSLTQNPRSCDIVMYMSSAIAACVLAYNA